MVLKKSIKTNHFQITKLFRQTHEMWQDIDQEISNQNKILESNGNDFVSSIFMDRKN